MRKKEAKAESLKDAEIKRAKKKKYLKQKKKKDNSGLSVPKTQKKGISTNQMGM